MLKLNRTTEYGLLALRHMSRQNEPAAVTSAREIADQYGLPFEITAKTLQRLRDTGIIQSAQGSRGGYTLQRRLSDVTLAEFVEVMEGPLAVVGCVGSDHRCDYLARCGMSGVMSDLNNRLIRFLDGIRLDELTSGADELSAERSRPLVQLMNFGNLERK